MTKKYILILVTYLAMQLSAFIGVPLVYLIGVLGFKMDSSEMELLASVIWIVFSFVAGLTIILLLLRRTEPFTKVEKETPMPVEKSFFWAIGGIFIAFISQLVAILIERQIGIDPGSENTEQIMNLIHSFPIVVLASSIIGPILEEIVFRKVIFGMLHTRFSFWISALISGLVFSIAHGEPNHLILYTAMGFTFAFLYVHTKRIIVPIISHAMMNTLVTVAQFIPQKGEGATLQYVQGIIGGIFG